MLAPSAPTRTIPLTSSSSVDSSRAMGCAMCVESDLPCKPRATMALGQDEICVQPNPHRIDLTHFRVAEDAVLGIGGFGLVRLVHARQGCGSFALKSVAKSDLLRRSNGAGGVLQELAAMQQLEDTHPRGLDFLCRLHCAFHDERFVYFVTEACLGGDMRFNLNAIPGHKFSESTAKFFISQIVLALHACHACGILHRDCKPENIILCSNGYVKLTDFGVARALEDLDRCFSTSGTHGYLAPEVYTSQHLHGRTADWFAMGVTLHEFLCGRRPFEPQRLIAFREPNHRDALEAHFLATRPLTHNAKAFTSACIERFPRHRIGYNGLTDIQQHPWFEDFDWDAIEKQTFKAPMLPHTHIHNKELLTDDTLRLINAHLASPSTAKIDQSKYDQFEFRTAINTVSSHVTNTASKSSDNDQPKLAAA